MLLQMKQFWMQVYWFVFFPVFFGFVQFFCVCPMPFIHFYFLSKYVKKSLIMESLFISNLYIMWPVHRTQSFLHITNTHILLAYEIIFFQFDIFFPTFCGDIIVIVIRILLSVSIWLLTLPKNLSNRLIYYCVKC